MANSGLATVALVAISGFSLWHAVGGAAEGWRTRGWVEVPAQVLAVEVVSGGRGSQKLQGSYSYEYEGAPYTGERLELLAGFGFVKLQQRLHTAMKSGEAITVYVDPLAPSQAVVDRDVGAGRVLGYLGLAALTGIGAIALWRQRGAKAA